MKTTNHPSVRANHAHKKTALAGAASKMISNSAHLTIGDCLRGVFDGEKPSRPNRRPKRGWKRPPKKGLDFQPSAWHCGYTVLNTPQLAVSAPVSHSGFFSSIGSLWSGSAQSYNSLRAKPASGLTAVLKYLITPQQGGFSTNQLGDHHGR